MGLKRDRAEFEQRKRNNQNSISNNSEDDEGEEELCLECQFPLKKRGRKQRRLCGHMKCYPCHSTSIKTCQQCVPKNNISPSKKPAQSTTNKSRNASHNPRKIVRRVSPRKRIPTTIIEETETGTEPPSNHEAITRNTCEKIVNSDVPTTNEISPDSPISADQRESNGYRKAYKIQKLPSSEVSNRTVSSLRSSSKKQKLHTTNANIKNTQIKCSNAESVQNLPPPDLNSNPGPTHNGFVPLACTENIDNETPNTQKPAEGVGTYNNVTLVYDSDGETHIITEKTLISAPRNDLISEVDKNNHTATEKIKLPKQCPLLGYDLSDISDTESFDDSDVQIIKVVTPKVGQTKIKNPESPNPSKNIPHKSEAKNTSGNIPVPEMLVAETTPAPKPEVSSSILISDDTEISATDLSSHTSKTKKINESMLRGSGTQIEISDIEEGIGFAPKSHPSTHDSSIYQADGQIIDRELNSPFAAEKVTKKALNDDIIQEIELPPACKSQSQKPTKIGVVCKFNWNNISPKKVPPETNSPYYNPCRPTNFDQYRNQYYRANFANPSVKRMLLFSVKHIDEHLAPENVLFKSTTNKQPFGENIQVIYAVAAAGHDEDNQLRLVYSEAIGIQKTDEREKNGGRLALVRLSSTPNQIVAPASTVLVNLENAQSMNDEGVMETLEFVAGGLKDADNGDGLQPVSFAFGARNAVAYILDKGVDSVRKSLIACSAKYPSLEMDAQPPATELTQESQMERKLLEAVRGGMQHPDHQHSFFVASPGDANYYYTVTRTRIGQQHHNEEIGRQLELAAENIAVNTAVDAILSLGKKQQGLKVTK